MRREVDATASALLEFQHVIVSLAWMGLITVLRMNAADDTGGIGIDDIDEAMVYFNDKDVALEDRTRAFRLYCASGALFFRCNVEHAERILRSLRRVQLTLDHRSFHHFHKSTPVPLLTPDLCAHAIRACFAPESDEFHAFDLLLMRGTFPAQTMFF